jgi:hypothetical protein
VHANDLWSVIGGKLGYVHFPGEPPKSGPGVAQQVANIYKEYLAAFDTVYIQSVMDAKRKQAFANQQSVANGQQNQQGSGSGQINQIRPPQNAQAMQQMLVYANVPPQELRARGVPEKMILFIEQRRADLQRTAAQQQAFRGMLSKNNQQVEQAGNPASAFSLTQQPQNPSLPNSMPQTGQRPGPQITQQGSGPNVTTMDAQFVRPPQVISAGSTQQGRMQRPTPEQVRQAHSWIMNVKSEFMTRSKLYSLKVR